MREESHDVESLKGVENELQLGVKGDLSRRSKRLRIFSFGFYLPLKIYDFSMSPRFPMPETKCMGNV